MTFTYSTKTRSYSRVLPLNTNQRLVNQNISKKESFYQYLFIQQIFNNSLLKEESSSSSFDYKKTNFFMTPFSSSLLTEESRKRKTLEKLKNQQIFITYKKSFLCYWLLPLLGLVGAAGPTFLQFSSAFPRNNHIMALPYVPQDVSASLSQPIKYNYSLLLSTPSNYNSTNSLLEMKQRERLEYNKNNDQKIVDEKIKKITQSKDGFTSQSLLLTAFNFYKGSSLISQSSSPSQSDTQLKSFKAGTNLNFTDLNFALLNRNIKARSTFKWYWFDLFLKTGLNESISTETSLNQMNLIPENKGIIDSLFPSKISNLHNSELDIKISNSNNGLLDDSFQKATSLFKKSFIKEENKGNFSSLKSFPTYLSLNGEKCLERKKLSGEILTKANLDIKNENFLVGVINHDTIPPSGPFGAIFKHSVETEGDFFKSPYMSIKKAYFLMDKLILSGGELFDSTALSPLFPTGQKINQTNLSDYSLNLDVKSNQSREKTILSIFKKSKSPFGALGANTSFQSNVASIKERKLPSNQKVINATESDLLYHSIFEGLKDSLDLIVDSKANTVDTSLFALKPMQNIQNKPNNFIVKKRRFIYPLSMSQSPFGGPSGGRALNKKGSQNQILSDFTYPFFKNTSINLEPFLKSKTNIHIKTKTYPYLRSAFGKTLLFKPNFKALDSTSENVSGLKFNSIELPKSSLKTQNSKFSVLKLSESIRGGNVAFSTLNSKKDQKLNPDLNTVTKSNGYDFTGLNSSQNNLFVDQFKNVKNFSNSTILTNDQSALKQYRFESEQNSFLFLSKYIGFITKNIKTTLSPYNLRSSYLPEINILKSKSNIFSNSEKSDAKFEKIFLSYLSKSKKENLSNSSNKNLSYLASASRLNNSFWNKSSIGQTLKLKSKVKLRNIKKLHVPSNYKKSLTLNGNDNSSKKVFKAKQNSNSSISVLFKNRLFINKAVANSEFDLSQKKKNGSNLSSKIHLEKRQTNKVKRRLKKMKGETRRRKKRKIFYPRPTWITFSTYKKFLNSRYSPSKLNNKKSDNDNNNNDKKTILKIKRRLFLNSNSNSNSNSNKDLTINTGRQNVYSHWLNNKRYNSQAIKTSNQEVLFKNTKDFYQISGNVFTDLKRVLMKSNWLRSYLNPYLDKVKYIYKEMQKSSQQMQVYANLRSFVLSFYNNVPSLLELNQNSFNNNKKLNETNGFDPPASTYLNLKHSLCEVQNYHTSIRDAYGYSSLIAPKGPEGGSKWNNNNAQVVLDRENTINLLEYNRIIYQRMQRVIFNIRENLNLNGQIKNRSKKLGRNIRAFIKRDYTKRDVNNGMPVNQNAILWSKIVKNNILKFGRSFVSYGYEETSPYNNAAQLLSRNNFYWALNKSASLPNTNFNASFTKKLWETYKIREVSKANKTKKIIYNMSAPLNNVFKPSNSLAGFNYILEPLFIQKGETSMNNKEIEDSKLSRFFYKKNILEKNQKEAQLNKNMYGFEDQSSKIPFTLPAQIYTIKSEQKLINIENKLKLLGVYSKKMERNYKNAYFRFLKNELVKEKCNTNPSNPNETVKFKESFANLKTKSLNDLSAPFGGKSFNTNFTILGNKNKMSNNYSYWWSSLKIDPTYGYLGEKNDAFLSTSFSYGMQADQVKVLKDKQIKNVYFEPNKQEDLSFKLSASSTLASFLFHFCALVSFISLGGVRALLKFYYILISKITKSVGAIEGVIGLFPKNNSFNSNSHQFADLNFQPEEENKPEFKSIYSMDFSPMKTKSYKNNEQLKNIEHITNKRSKKRSSVSSAFSKNSNSILSSKKGELNREKQNNIISKNLKLYFLKYLTARTTKSADLNLAPRGPKGLGGPEGANFNSNSNKGYLKELKTKSKFLISNTLPSSNKLNSNSADYRSVIKIDDTNNSTNEYLFGLKNVGLIFSSLQNQKEGKMNGLNNKDNVSLNKNKLKLMYYSYLRLSTVTRFGHKLSFYSYLLLLKSVDVLAVPASFIYKFFEKPGEYVVENLAYSFLVEWSADLIATIPDTVDTTQSIYFGKINRAVSPLMLINLNMGINPIQNSILMSKFPFHSLSFGSYLREGFLFGLSNSVLKRLLNSSFLVFVQQLCEPDLDYMNRKKKAQSVWDIWGEHLKTVAEENSINIYELTTDKEEQVKLLSKYEEVILNNDENGMNGSNTNNYLFLKHSLYSLNQKTKKTSSNLNSNSLNKNLNSLLNIKKGNNSISKLSGDKKRLALKNFREKTNRFNTNPSFIENQTLHSLAQSKTQNYYGWSVSQFLSYQGKDTDLFIDLHPPKNFSSSAASLKYSYSVQQPIGSIVCQIFSGIFYKQISKNILVVGSAGLEKSLLIQAIAGETELKIITDNAHRYAMVYRGVAVGIKLLKDVFEALSVHTPCIFLMEEIHAIGERRPFLIDESSSNSTESTYNKNQSMQALFLKEKSSSSREGLYKNNKHLLSHYKKPYKEPRSLATNHFSFTFLFGDLFAKVRTNEIKLSSALSIQVVKKENESKYKNVKSKLKDELSNHRSNIYSSSLLIKPSNTEGPGGPASSPFSVLSLKEASKLKHKKAVKEMPWFGLPGEQFSLVSKYNYSIRVKVALLADLVLSNLSVKLDMITDLLVIIDSVKSNRGFVVFATTHVPYILDPALRRPGRFDETISLPLIPSLYSRWANYRSNVQYLTTSLFKQYSIPFNSSLHKGTTLDLTSYNLLSNNSSQTFPIEKLIQYIYIHSSTSSLFNDFEYESFLENNNPNINIHAFQKGLKSGDKSKLKKWKHLIPLLSQKNSNNKLNHQNIKKLLPLYYSSLNSGSLINSTSKYALSLQKFKQTKALSFNDYLFKKTSSKRILNKRILNKNKNIKKTSSKQILQLKSRNYSNASRSLISLMLYTYQTKDSSKSSLSLKWPNMLQNSLLNVPLEDYSAYLSLFNSDKIMLKMILMSLIGGKLGESFTISSNFKTTQQSHKSGSKNDGHKDKLERQITDSFLFSFDKSWKYGSSLLFSYIQKRECSALNKNLAFCSTKLMSLNNKYSLMEAPSPPISNILLPAKRYENYKRTFNNQYDTLTGQNNFNGSMSEKIQFHQQQRLLKRLYKYPIKEFFRSHLLKGNDEISNFSNFNNSYLVLGPLEKTNLASVNKLTNVNWCYRNILYNRHKTYLTNQWWNAQQGEHNAETTFLSDIDWRYTFVKSIGDINIDFPDSEQFYNPRNRRWVLTNGDWNYWFNIDAELKDIYSHYVYECFTKAYKYLDQNREILDFYAESLHQAPLTSNLKERNLLNLYKRFF